MKVLYIEDNSVSVRLVGRVVRNIGGELTAVGTGAGAINQLGQPFDVILCDLGLPDMDGVQIIRAIRERLPTVPIVAMTGYGMNTERQACFEAGCNAYLAKPIEPSDLENLLRRLLTSSPP